jgi:hypothetical protein
LYTIHATSASEMDTAVFDVQCTFLVVDELSLFVSSSALYGDGDDIGCVKEIVEAAAHVFDGDLVVWYDDSFWAIVDDVDDSVFSLYEFVFLFAAENDSVFESDQVHCL